MDRDFLVDLSLIRHSVIASSNVPRNQTEIRDCILACTAFWYIVQDVKEQFVREVVRVVGL
jgi:hypothetical protein